MSILAVDGGSPVRTNALAPWPFYDEDEIAVAERVLRSGKVNYWTGSECRRFEAEFAEFHGVNHGVALANGTLALELALRVLNIGSGDEVIVTPRSYFASASCIVLAGAKPVFVDVNINSQNITANSVASAITNRTKAIIVVHLAGWPCDMPAIMNLARRHDLFVVEDCAQAHGACVDGQLVGSFGDLSAFSFCQDKIMTTGGEGGMLLTNNEKYWSDAWSFKEHGKSWERVHASDHPPGFRWLHEGIGSNWRLTEIQAAIGRLQLRKLERWVAQRRANAHALNEAFKEVKALRLTLPPENEHHTYYKYYTFIRPERLRRNWTRDRILAALQAEGIPGWSGSCPEIYLEKAMPREGQAVLPVARELGDTSIMLPVHPTLSNADVADIVSAVRKVLQSATAE